MKKFLKGWVAWILFVIAAWGIIGHTVDISLINMGLTKSAGLPYWEYGACMIIYALCLYGWWKLK